MRLRVNSGAFALQKQAAKLQSTSLCASSRLTRRKFWAIQILRPLMSQRRLQCWIAHPFAGLASAVVIAKDKSTV